MEKIDTSMEIFRDIVGYNGYQISSLGRVWSSKTQRYIKPHIRRDGYCELSLVAINGKRKTELVHRLVAIAFLPNPNHLPCVNHKDECKTNNKVDNLEWISHKDNNNYGTHNQRIAEKLRKPVVVVETGEVFDSGKEAAEALGVCPQTVSKVLVGKRNTAKGFHLKFLD